MKRLFRFRYPKIMLFVVCIVVAYYLFNNSFVGGWVNDLGDLGYFGVFIAGILLPMGFTAPFSVGFFLTVDGLNIFWVAVIGAIGALLADLFIFSMIRTSFMDEFISLENTHPAKVLRGLIRKNLHLKVFNYFSYAIAGLIIASPLPDEVGVSMLGGLTEIKPHVLAIWSFILHIIGILFIILLGIAI